MVLRIKSDVRPKNRHNVIVLQPIKIAKSTLRPIILKEKVKDLIKTNQRKASIEGLSIYKEEVFDKKVRE